MSAFIHSRSHIDVLVQALAEGEIVTDVDPDGIGCRLWAENLASVAYRYPRDGDGERPGPIDFRDADVTTYTYRRPSLAIPRPALVLAAQGYEYQSCEHPGWKHSVAYRWITTLLDNLDRAGITSAGAPVEAWSYDEADVHGVPADTH